MKRRTTSSLLAISVRAIKRSTSVIVICGVISSGCTTTTIRPTLDEFKCVVPITGVVTQQNKFTLAKLLIGGQSLEGLNIENTPTFHVLMSKASADLTTIQYLTCVAVASGEVASKNPELLECIENKRLYFVLNPKPEDFAKYIRENSCPPFKPRSPDLVLNFDTVNTYSDTKTPIDARSYLGAFDIELREVTPGTQVVMLNHLGSYGGMAFLPVSRPNILTQLGSNDPVSFTLIFSRPLSKLSFVLPPLIAATQSGITFPKWRADAFDGRGNRIASVANNHFGSYKHEDSRTFILEPIPRGEACIKALKFTSDNGHFAAFSAIMIDDLTLFYAPPSKCI
ncbi:MAG: hypothetical protein WBK08_06740 [Nitrospira sp.]